MAYAAVASVSETIDIILKYHKTSISPEFEHQIRSVQKHSVFFRSFLVEFSERAKNWDETIREVTDWAEEIIELLLSDLLMAETTTSTGSGSRSVHYSFGDLERVIEEMESISNRVNGKHAEEASGGGNVELMEIIDRLREGSSPWTEVITIVGIPGMGKAALAKNVYDHPLIVKHFEVRAWSTISQDYSWKRAIAELLSCMKLPVDNIESVSQHEMIERLDTLLYSRRYLIVLNDIWSIEAWDMLREFFPRNGNGSRIILTTRSSHVGRAAGANYIHEMRWLDEDETWNVVRRNVFRGDPCPPQLEPVGKKIAGCCGGHPLCTQVVSGILAAADHTVAAWEDISQNIISNNDEFSDILSLSYTYLPHHLRPCFLYLGCFPEDHEINVSKLIKLWVAEGFLNETESKSCEHIGEEYVEDLVRRGMVSVSKTKSNGTTIKSIIIHHLMRDVCLKQARTDNFNYAVRGKYYVGAMELLSCRRVSIYIYDDNDDDVYYEGVYGATTRTIILSSYTNRFRWPVANLRLLKVLDLLHAYSHDLDDQLFFHLFHLRYLAIRCRFKISKAISDLRNLETLIIFPTANDGGQLMAFDGLADGIWRMPQLRHFLTSHLNLPLPATQIGGIVYAPLEDLETLSGVVNFICSRDSLKMIPNLKKLALFYMTKDVVLADFELHNLIYLHKLQILKIQFDTPFQQHHNMRCAFKFPPSLKKLHLDGRLGIPWEDMNKIVASLPNLEVLKLRSNACMDDTWETSEGGFSHLIYLLIEECDLENWITETSHFPKLKHLVLRRCPSLLKVPDDIGMILTLELIELDEDNQSLLSSANRIQKDRQSSGDDHLHIRAV